MHGILFFAVAAVVIYLVWRYPLLWIEYKKISSNPQLKDDEVILLRELLDHANAGCCMIKREDFERVKQLAEEAHLCAVGGLPESGIQAHK